MCVLLRKLVLASHVSEMGAAGTLCQLLLGV